MRNVYLMLPEELGTIRREVYGHFAEHIGGVIYDGIWVSEASKAEHTLGFRQFIIDKLKDIKAPVMRWPGGCFAESYDWRDGIGSERKKRVNWWTYADGHYESNEVGTHEFMEFCRLTGADPYFAANMTSVTPLHVRDWVDYCNSPKGSTSLAKEREENGDAEPFSIKYWGIGNENWGGGGNMTPEQYGLEYRRYVSQVNNVPGDKVLIACGPNGDDYAWTKGVMEALVSSEKHMDGLSLHYYCGFAGDPTAFTEAEWYQQLGQALRMEEIIKRHWSIIEAYGMEEHARLVIDEWGCWHPDGSGPSKGGNLFEQQSTMRDGVVAALTLNVFNNHCDKILMANVAQLVNNLHALFLAAGEDCIVTPTYHVFDLFKEHQGARAVRTFADCETIVYEDKEGRASEMKDLSVSASVKEECVTVTMVNLSATEDLTVRLCPVGGTLEEEITVRVLSAEDYHAHNTFAKPERVKPVQYTGRASDGVRIPKAGVVSIAVRKLHD